MKDMTVEPECHAILSALHEQEQDATDLSHYPWNSGVDAVRLKHDYPEKTLEEVRDVVGDENIPRKKKRNFE